jgi:hypothetical protein
MVDGFPTESGGKRSVGRAPSGPRPPCRAMIGIDINVLRVARAAKRRRDPPSLAPDPGTPRISRLPHPHRPNDPRTAAFALRRTGSSPDVCSRRRSQLIHRRPYEGEEAGGFARSRSGVEDDPLSSAGPHRSGGIAVADVGGIAERGEDLRLDESALRPGDPDFEAAAGAEAAYPTRGPG